MTTDTQFLHLHCGDCSADSLRKSGVPGQVRVWYDPFSEGPVPSGVSGEEWLALRASTPIVLDRVGAIENGIRFFGEMYQQMEEFRDFEETVLWFDACLFDQTILIRHLDWFSRQDMGNTKLSLICIGEFPGMSRFKGLGELHPEQMASLLDTRHDVTKREKDLAVEAWVAYRSPDPTEIETFLRKDTSALPYVAPALKRHLQRFPSVRNGLSRLEQASFQAISQGHTGFMDLFKRVSDLEDPPYFGDTMMLSQLEVMTSGPNPLLRMEGREFTQGLRQHEWPIDNLSFHLTDTGRDVLDARADRVRMSGIDRWLGGVHLQGHEVVWRWDEDRGRMM